MKQSEKQEIIDGLVDQMKQTDNFYITDIADLNAQDTSDLRRLCFKRDVKLVVVKNALLAKAFEKSQLRGVEQIVDSPVLKGHTSVMFAEQGNIPAKLIKEFRKEHEKPILKAAYIGEAVYFGDDQVEALIKLKSKEELLGEIIGLLQSPAVEVISLLKSGESTLLGLLNATPTKLHGILKALSERE